MNKYSEELRIAREGAAAAAGHVAAFAAACVAFAASYAAGHVAACADSVAANYTASYAAYATRADNKELDFQIEKVLKVLDTEGVEE